MPDRTPKQPGINSIARVLGERVHSDLTAAYRELVDRAADACARRAARDPSFRGSILVSTQTLGGINHAAITDNGETFEADAFRQLYDVIQRGRTGAVARALDEARDPSDVVGTFGAALMAAFLVADRITITSRAHEAAPAAGLVFACDSRSYELTPATVPRPGTVVQLRVRVDRQKFGSLEIIREALAKHALEIPFPIRIGADPTPINA
jgi:molecular chaperone HtpG